MSSKPFNPGRDKVERQRFQTETVFTQKMANEANMLNILAQNKRNIKYLRGGWLNRLRCWMLNTNPMFTYINIQKEYERRNSEGRADQSKSDQRGE